MHSRRFCPCLHYSVFYNEYAKTRHNVGFMLVDALAEHLNINLWKDKFNAQIAEGRTGAVNGAEAFGRMNVSFHIVLLS